jgi:hypothetical protein
MAQGTAGDCEADPLNLGRCRLSVRCGSASIRLVCRSAANHALTSFSPLYSLPLLMEWTLIGTQ